MEKYERGIKIGEGTFGVVFLGKEKETGDEVALKKIKVGTFTDGVHFTALREIKLLQEIRHPNIIGLRDVFQKSENMVLVLDYCASDLELLINDKSVILNNADIKAFMKMILEGLNALHKKWVVHRDMKPSNLLYGKDGILKLADFGLARLYGSPDRKMTSEVCTRWYRPPELLFGAQHYGAGVDVWGAGCIFAELMLRVPYFSGDSDLDQLDKIFQGLGTPTVEQWPGMTSLPDYVQFEKHEGTPFRFLFTAATGDALDLLGKLLTFNPAKRISAEEALEHPYFKNAPYPTPPEKLPQPTVKQQDKKAMFDERIKETKERAQRSPMRQPKF